MNPSFFLILCIVLAIVFLNRKTSDTRSIQNRAINVTAADIPKSSTVYTGALQSLSGGLTRTKKALLFGLNYTGTANQLYGCIQDVQNVKTYLQGLSYSVTMYTDLTPTRPTRANMISLLTTFLRSLGPQDTAFIWYSGHGTLLSGGINAWVPLDFQASGFLSERTITPLLSTLNAGVRLIIGSDSCYSGSMANLRYDLEPTTASRSLTSLDIREVEKVPITVATSRTVPSDHDVAHPTEFVQRAIAAQNYRLYDTRQPSVSASIVHISGCRDNQTSADAYVDAASQGAMTWSFLKSLRTTGLTIGQIQDVMRSTLKSRFTQVPQFSFGRPIDPKTNISFMGLS
jgi:hypothetical protein